DQEDVGLVELDFGIRLFAVNQPLVVVVNGDREDLLGTFLADHVGVELFLDLPGGRDIGKERFRHAAAAPLLVEDRLAQLAAIAANVDVAWTFHKGSDIAVTLTAERAVSVFLGASGASRTHVPTTVPLTAAGAAARDVLT